MGDIHPLPVIVLVSEVGRRPHVREMTRGLEEMQYLVGGYVDRVEVAPGVDCWFNDEGLLLGLPLNRRIPAYDQPGEWRIHGDLFLARHDGRGNTVSLTLDDIRRWRPLLSAEDPAAATEMDLMRMVLRGQR